jgi:glycosyltransferase involved in cell wall biosynthesis
MTHRTQQREPPTVSVVIPAYNAAPLLAETLDSVLAQTYRDFEVVLVDDGSTDATPDVAARYEDDIRYVRKENGGSASARNRGIREARGAYVALLDADDQWRPRKLERQMALFDEQPALKWSYTDWLLVDARTRQVVYRAGQRSQHPDGDVLRSLVGPLFIPPSTVIVAREVFEEVGVYDESALHRISEDWEFTLRVAARYPVGYVDEPLTRRPRHAEGKTSTMDLEHALESRLAIVEKAVRRSPGRLAEVRDAALANQYTNLGRKHLERDERRRAVRLCARAFRHQPAYPDAWIYGIAALLPRPVLRLMRMVRERFWTWQRDGEGTA